MKLAKGKGILMAESVLKLSTLIERPTIIVDGVSYEIMSPDELSVLDHHRLGSWGKQLDALMDIESLDDEGEKKLSCMLHNIPNFSMVVVPAAIPAKCSAPRYGAPKVAECQKGKGCSAGSRIWSTTTSWRRARRDFR